MAALTDKQTEALREFASANGRNWKSKLLLLWGTPLCTGELQAIRNLIGPSGLRAIKL